MQSLPLSHGSPPPACQTDSCSSPCYLQGYAAIGCMMSLGFQLLLDCCQGQLAVFVMQHGHSCWLIFQYILFFFISCWLCPCAGPIRAEDGNRYYETALGGAKGDEVKFFESWSSIRSLYKHMFTSPAVASVFRSEAFAAATADMKMEGPFKVC